MNSRSRQAITLLELMMVMAIFAFVSGLIVTALSNGFRKSASLGERASCQRRLAQAWTWLRRDLAKASSNEIATKRVSNVPGSGDVIWFLSAEDEFQTDSNLRLRRESGNGRPMWSRHIIYYLIRPNNYPSISFGLNPGLDPDVRNDFFAPHKLLMRKVVDRPGDPERLMTSTEIDAYTTAPDGYNFAAMSSEAGLLTCRIVTSGMLSMESQLIGRTLRINLRTVQIRDAARSLALGQVSLRESRFTRSEEAQILLNN